MGDLGDDEFLTRQISLADLKKSESRVDREDEDA